MATAKNRFLFGDEFTRGAFPGGGGMSRILDSGGGTPYIFSSRENLIVPPALIKLSPPSPHLPGWGDSMVHAQMNSYNLVKTQ